MRDLLRSSDKKVASLIASLCRGMDLSLEDERRVRLFVPMVLVALAVLFSSFIINIHQLSPFRSGVILATAGGQLISLLALRYLAAPKIAFRISVLVFEAYFLFLLCVGGNMARECFGF